MKKIYYFALFFALMWSQACVQAPQTTSKPEINFLLQSPSGTNIEWESTDVGAFAWFAKQ